jgi:hypothetical protein
VRGPARQGQGGGIGGVCACASICVCLVRFVTGECSRREAQRGMRTHRRIFLCVFLLRVLTAARGNRRTSWCRHGPAPYSPTRRPTPVQIDRHSALHAVSAGESGALPPHTHTRTVSPPLPPVRACVRAVFAWVCGVGVRGCARLWLGAVDVDDGQAHGIVFFSHTAAHIRIRSVLTAAGLPTYNQRPCHVRPPGRPPA